ncbi:uncharacterized protein LOC113272755 [Papaver somniferum]|uniref:uncharacterized protein LOC113272755 n=1 Tax=Papaver somniferum TaxID=3469 RepID=UPI000E703B6B|nr:uncharacterized protein LOC113272755 [Papaver somniferum]
MEIAKAWDKTIQGSPRFNLVKKLQLTRIALSKWNKVHSGDINQNVDILQKQLADLQALPFSQDNTSKATELSKELDKWHQIQYEFNKQKSRDNFVKDMDYNTKYFHTLTKRKRARNNIDSPRDQGGNWIHTRDEIVSLLTAHFQNISTSGNPNIEEHHYANIHSVITEEDNRLLLVAPTNEEILKTLKNMESWSAPGPEGFQAGFYKSQWNTVGEDVCEMVKNFFSTNFLPKKINKTYISLIPKKNKPSNPSEFRPISLCNTSYKIISKILVSRMKPLMDRIISPYQAAYVSGRSINDNTIVAHELIHSMKRKQGEGGWLALKLDMSKAFDRLEWPFLIKLAFERRLGNWQGINLHQVGRTTMVKPVLNVVPMYQMSTFKMPKKLQNMCLSKDLGGLAFRDLEMLNHALLTKLAWRVCQNSDHLLSMILKAKYFKKEDFLHLSEEKYNTSWTWKGIELGLSILQQNYCMEVNNGKGTKIWVDVWVIGLNSKVEPLRPSHLNYVYVSEMIIEESNSWNTSLLDTLFSQDIMDKIKKMKLFVQEEDTIKWTPSKDGNFIVKSACNKLMEAMVQQQTALNIVPTTVWREPWKMKLPHRIKLFIWKCLKGIVPTRLRLSQAMQDIETHCEICKHEEESLYHLLISCNHAKAVWRSLSINIDQIIANSQSVQQ